MATNFPTSLDTYYDKIDNVSTVLATSVNNLQDAVEALQTKVGKNDSTASSTFDYMLSDFFAENTRQMYFYQHTPPTGWSTSGLATNCVVAVKGGAQAWNTTGGSTAGQWTINDQVADSHNHAWRYWPGSSNIDYAWDSTGSTYVANTPSGAVASVNTYRGPLIRYFQYGHGFEDSYTDNSQYLYTANDSHTHTFAATWRPLAALGIIAKYTGS